MKAIILAAGFGERMRPLSERCPKPLLPVLSRPLIDYTIDQLSTAAIREIGVNSHHLAHRLASYLDQESRWNMAVTLSPEAVIRGTGGGMLGLKGFLTGADPFIVHNGDIFSTIDLRQVVAFHRRRAPLATLVLVNHPPVNSVTIAPEGAITDFQGVQGAFRPGHDRNLTFAGISVVDPAVLDLIPDIIPYSIIDVYLDLIERSPGSICGYVPDQPYWIDIGNPAAYLQVHCDILIHGRAPLFSESRQSPGIFCAAGAVLDPEADLQGFISLGKNSRIEKNVSLKNCVVWDNTVVPSHTRLINGVIDGNWNYQIAGS